MTEGETLEIVAEGLGFPEGPVVMSDGSVIVVEVTGGRVSRCWDGRKEVICEIGGGPNGAAVGPDGALYVCNNGGIDHVRLQSASGPGTEGRIERIDLSTGKFERLYDRCGEHGLNGPNDLVFDAQGNLWFTDLGKVRDRKRDQSGLFRCAPDGSGIEEIWHGALSYNGVGIAPDDHTVYVADTHQARVYAFDLDDLAKGPRLLATVPGQVMLDSLAVTAAGNVCVAQLVSGGIATVTPSGDVSLIAMPDTRTTNIAFGGGDMRDAYITLSASGRLARTRWAEPGLKLHFNA